MCAVRVVTGILDDDGTGVSGLQMAFRHGKTYPFAIRQQAFNRIGHRAVYQPGSGGPRGGGSASAGGEAGAGAFGFYGITHEGLKQGRFANRPYGMVAEASASKA